MDPGGAAVLDAVMHRLTGDTSDAFPGIAEQAKREIVDGPLYAEVNRLTSLAAGICHDDLRLRDHTWRALEDCLIELLVAFDRYRAYVVPGEPVHPESLEVLHTAAAHARRRLPPERAATMDVVVDLLLGREVGSAGQTRGARRDELIVRFQQTCGAVMAKGVEDTAFYRWTHLVGLCEVGGAPEQFALTPTDLSAWAARMQVSSPLGMTTLSTHDTKRGEDTRSRLGVLSELPREWSQLVDRLRAATAPYRSALLDGRTEYLLWQTLAGTWTDHGPISEDRLVPYLTKAIREAKSRTTWTAPDEPYERAVLDAARQALVDPEVAALFTEWEVRTRPAVRAATLGTKLVQLTLPGVADVYQGTEVPDPVLVDPDNRRFVDVAPLAARLVRLDDGAGPRDLADEKLLVTSRALRLRHDLPEAFVGPSAGFRPLAHSSGPLADLRPDRRRRPAGRGRRDPARRGGRPARRLGGPHGRAARRRLVRRADRAPGARWRGRRRRHPRPAARRAARAGAGLRMLPRVWAPNASTVDLVIGDERVPMARADAWWETDRDLAARHRLRVLRSTAARPGPTRAAPGSRPACTARAACSTPRSSPGPTRPGTASTSAARSSTSCTSARSPRRAPSTSAAAELPSLVALGVDVVELMPVAPFDGDRGWGYDGVGLYAVHEAYGGPAALQRFVDTAHGLGLGVCLDVVYNHLGPSGAYVGEFGPYWTDAHETPWGAAINLDQPGSDEVRRWIIEQRPAVAGRLPRRRAAPGRRARAGRRPPGPPARAAVQPGRGPVVDARPTAVAGRRDRPERHRLGHPDRRRRLGHDRAVGRRRAPRDPRPAHRRAARLLRRLRHARRAAQGADRGVRARRHLVDVPRRGLGSAGVPPTPTATGSSSASRPTTRWATARSATAPRSGTPTSSLAASAALLILSPFTPMLFMGEEWGTRTPFQFFTSYADPALAAAVREGRTREFGGHGWAELYGGDVEVPDPQALVHLRGQHPRPRRAGRPGARPHARLVPDPDRAAPHRPGPRLRRPRPRPT